MSLKGRYTLSKELTAREGVGEKLEPRLRAVIRSLVLRRIEVEQTRAERWNGQLPQNVDAGAPMPFLNVGR